MRGMMWRIVAVVFIASQAGAIAASHASKTPDVYLSGPAFPVSTLQFTVPSKWQGEPPETSARAGQWRVPPLRPDGESGEVVAYFFGPGVGGNAKDNIEAWISTMLTAEGHPAAAEQKHHTTNGLKISQVVIFGTYNQVVSMPGVPPQPKMNYGLLGAVVENPQGNIYWRFTGPEALITATLPLFNKVIDSVRPQNP